MLSKCDQPRQAHPSPFTVDRQPTLPGLINFPYWLIPLANANKFYDEEGFFNASREGMLSTLYKPCTDLRSVWPVGKLLTALVLKTL